jgi:hypothetical protein
LTNKIILDPQGGKGNIIDYCKNFGASDLLGCEINEDLKKILQTKCKVIASDFLTVTSDQISHINYIIMNPPFSAEEKHILHAWEIAPAGCKIISLCNASVIENATFNKREQIKQLVNESGSFENLGDCFLDAERKTGVYIGLIKLQKPADNYKSEFCGFFMEEDDPERQENALMSYNVVRDLVNRYVAAVKIFDEQLDAAVRMNDLTRGFYSSGIGLNLTADQKPITRNEFKKEMQKSGWNFIFNKMDMKKYSTQGLKEDINKFVEQQQQIPFTMKNIYRMIEIVIGTQGQRMDKALIEVFDKVISMSDENKYFHEGWKTNSHYLLNKKFIVPGICFQDNFYKQYHPEDIRVNYGGYSDRIDDFVKALCYISGGKYDQFSDLRRTAQMNKYGQLFDWGYFRIRAYKKGTMHFEFKDADLWGKFNQRIAKIKGYPLYEHTKREENKKTEQATNFKVRPVILETITL